MKNQKKQKKAKCDHIEETINFQDIELIRDNKKVVWEYLGEGWSGDYDPNDPDDTPLLRFSCFQYKEAYQEWDEGNWEELPDSSYCTGMPISTSIHILVRALGEILEAIQDVNYKSRLEDYSHFCPEHFA